ncbi:hypothetical protein BJ508DRAFT_367698 [Ascobolus immersus RN42]|uniref:Pre-mRNA-splicing factor n=1 Tax=Ascobolus immersus RN42 TaxID=1160509 RepID=A0A3N4HD36_ASCIM|nr:hypothetical protein BJ508DRAFT_367698 [Ascobolus immersus RN42]
MATSQEQPSLPALPNEENRPSISELHGGHPLAQAAQRLWIEPEVKKGKKKGKFDSNVVKTEIWDALEREGFRYRSLLLVESLGGLEKFLWPNFTEDSTNYHILCIALMVNVKRRENVPVWDCFQSNPALFTTLFRRLLTTSLDPTLPLALQTHLLTFLTTAFESLDTPLVRKECAPLVSIAIWNQLHSESVREERFDKYPSTRKLWRASGKRFDAADDEGKQRLKFERSWLARMVLGFFGVCYSTEGDNKERVVYCERFVEFLTDLESQLPTRRYVNLLLQDLNVLTVVKRSPLYREPENGLFRDMVGLLEHFVYFSIDDHTGEQLSREESRKLHCGTIAKLQRVALKSFKEKLTILALSNYGAVSQREELRGHLKVLDEEEVKQLAEQLGLRTTYPQGVEVGVGREFWVECVLDRCAKRVNFRDEIAEMAVLPTETSLFHSPIVKDERYDGSRPLPVPKLNLQYLTIGDFLWRSFLLYRAENFFGIRRDLEDSIARLQPKLLFPRMETQFSGSSTMALIISKPSILEVAPPKVGDDKPAYIRAEINVNIGHLHDRARREWERLGQGDVVFLASVRGYDEEEQRLRGLEGVKGEQTPAEKYGVRKVRSAEVIQVLDHEGKPLVRDTAFIKDDLAVPNWGRRIHVRLDRDVWGEDQAAVESGKADVYEGMNVLIRRKGIENNFKPVLQSIQDLAQSEEVPIPAWLQDVFLGYGDPESATYQALGQIKSLDFRDTFLDWDHLQESFPEQKVLSSTGAPIDPPYIITCSPPPAPEVAAPKTKKRKTKKAAAEEAARAEELAAAWTVSSYKLPNQGPYPIDKPRHNTLRFTPAQTDAILAGTNPGLTIIVGPPGTGKTDVVTQIISNIYHNFPNQKTLLVAHSNQALNQLFAKIKALDIDARHLLRLGHGESEDEQGQSFSKAGRVESFLENRGVLLQAVDKLAATMGAVGAHGDSCETAGYFWDVWVKPAWSKFGDYLEGKGFGKSVKEGAVEVREGDGLSVEGIVEHYPFTAFFSDANGGEGIFTQEVLGKPVEEVLEVAMGGYRHIEKVFTELEDIRPFELLRGSRERQAYLLAQEARIVAMTATHAGMRRREIAAAGFRYDNVVMEEAAQVTEAETFIPLCLQEARKEGGLKRVILVGDHFQNLPIVQNLPLRAHARLDQSLFYRLIRLGVKTHFLNQQGRCRPEIADLFRWRYTNPPLLDLPAVREREEFKLANAGFRHTFQFINVGPFKGQGETRPSPNVLQNLGEAEYAVALYQYMRLLSYPSSAITILTTYAGQRALIRDVLELRCKGNPLFGMPRVQVVDRFQGEESAFVILSLVRTEGVGFLRDVRRVTVALSRARLGLYVLGRREVFEASPEVREALDKLTENGTRSDKLELVTGEMYPTKRKADEPLGGEEGGDGGNKAVVVMEGVEHLGQYVFEMTKTKLEALKEERRRVIEGRK